MSDPAKRSGMSSPEELMQRLEAERSGEPFLLHCDGQGVQVITPLLPEASGFTVGRASSNRVRIGWDESVSRVHAEFVWLGAEWAIVDDGLSRNGSFVNGERVSGRRRLREGDAIRIGQTLVTYRAPADSTATHTAMVADLPNASTLSPAQRRVLVALARPFHDATGIVTPATNQQIASELFLSVDAVKTHLRALGVKFGVQGLPQNQKRAKLVERALATGVINRRDLA